MKNRANTPQKLQVKIEEYLMFQTNVQKYFIPRILTKF